VPGMEYREEIVWRRVTIRRGDEVTVLPSAPGRRDGFVGQFLRAKVDLAGQVLEIEVYGARKGRTRSWRTLYPERVRGRRQGPTRPKRGRTVQQPGHDGPGY
jgi:hypothetical protein